MTVISVETYIALLRGINVGGNNKLPMRDLAAIFTAAGCRNVRTYIQSGNVVFASSTPSQLPAILSQNIERQFGFRVPVILRSAAELASALHRNPFAAAGIPEEQLHVYFLADTPSFAAVAALNPDRSPGDSFTVLGRDIFLHLPNGVARTKLTNAFFDKALATVSTLRNARTIRTLVEMSGHAAV